MKKLLFGTIILALVSVFPVMTMAGVDVSVGISIPLPPPVMFAAPPPVVVLPDTDGVYVAPDASVDIFFWNGFWWRPWQGHWYRSPYYDRGWAYFDRVPRFYSHVDPNWRGNYHNHMWQGHSWNYQPIPHAQLQQNWKTWQSNRSWGNQKNWGVQGYTPKPQQQRQVLGQPRQTMNQGQPRQMMNQGQPRQTMNQQKPEVQRHQQIQRQQMQQQNRGASHQQPRGHEGKGEEHGR
jgi:hypothetical protein